MIGRAGPGSDPDAEPRRPNLTSHVWLHAQLVLVGAHGGVFFAYNLVLAVLRDPSPWRYAFWGAGLVIHVVVVWALARRHRHEHTSEAPGRSARRS